MELESNPFSPFPFRSFFFFDRTMCASIHVRNFVPNMMRSQRCGALLNVKNSAVRLAREFPTFQEISPSPPLSLPCFSSSDCVSSLAITAAARSAKMTTMTTMTTTTTTTTATVTRTGTSREQSSQRQRDGKWYKVEPIEPSSSGSRVSLAGGGDL